MAIYTQEELNQEISDWKKALSAVRHGREYMIGSRRLTRNDLKEIREHLEWLDRQRSKAGTGCGMTVLVGRPAR